MWILKILSLTVSQGNALYLWQKLPPPFQYFVKFESNFLKTSFSSMMDLWHIKPGRPLICWSKWHQHFISRTLWPLISRDLNSIDCCVGDSTRTRWRRWNCCISSSRRSKMILISELLTLQSGNDTADWGHFEYDLVTLYTFAKIHLQFKLQKWPIIAEVSGLFSGYRVSRSILELVPNTETFRMTLRAVRLWAQCMYF